MKFLIACVLLVGAVLSGCAPVATEPDPRNNGIDHYTVVLAPNLATNTLDILSGPQGWESAGKQNGWVGFYPDTYGSILFMMDEKPSKSACTDDPETSAGWVITKLYLTKNGKPQTQKGNNFGTNQTGWIARAFPQMNSTNGEVLNVDKSKGQISFVLTDENNDRSARTAYYQISATRCSDGYTLTSDPGIGNGGRR